MAHSKDIDIFVVHEEGDEEDKEGSPGRGSGEWSGRFHGQSNASWERLMQGKATRATARGAGDGRVSQSVSQCSISPVNVTDKPGSPFLNLITSREGREGGTQLCPLQRITPNSG